MVPAHSMPIITKAISDREQKYRGEHSLSFDEVDLPPDLHECQQEAQECRSMKFRLSGFGKSGVPMLTGQIRVDYLELPVIDILDQFESLKQGIVCGVYKHKSASPWKDLRTEKVQVPVFLPNEDDMKTWYAAGGTPRT